jgi:hypothetical protein
MWREYLQRVRQRNKKIHVRLPPILPARPIPSSSNIEYVTFAEMEPSQCRLTNQPDGKEFYQKFIPIAKNPNEPIIASKLHSDGLPENYHQAICTLHILLT